MKVITVSKDNEDEDMDGIANTGKQADLESGPEKKTVQKPTHISPRDFTHWLAAKSRMMTLLCNHYLSGNDA